MRVYFPPNSLHKSCPLAVFFFFSLALSHCFFLSLSSHPSSFSACHTRLSISLSPRLSQAFFLFLLMSSFVSIFLSCFFSLSLSTFFCLCGPHLLSSRRGKQRKERNANFITTATESRRRDIKRERENGTRLRK